MTKRAREFIDFWIQNSIHAVEQYRTAGASQDVNELTRRLIEAAKGQGISEVELQAEIGDVSRHVGDRLKEANRTERDRRGHTYVQPLTDISSSFRFSASI
ncbi:DUF768 domain-containing protein [Bradyrhizobium sp. Arg68]|uniref:hypothetical protein n=1 Tax=Bradyrhizobium ivorense TaxID=2511166 RepID=UPI001E5FC901|nr:hypothetical protein [Bradyrhizobium ivorense]MCC8937567.1 DUF768 domain-containing protein [Bradyrhizobium ivorense]